MSLIGLPGIAMLLVLANVALCLTAESQKRGLLDPPLPSSFAAAPLRSGDSQTTSPTPPSLPIDASRR